MILHQREESSLSPDPEQRSLPFSPPQHLSGPSPTSFPFAFISEKINIPAACLGWSHLSLLWIPGFSSSWKTMLHQASSLLCIFNLSLPLFISLSLFLCVSLLNSSQTTNIFRSLQSSFLLTTPWNNCFQSHQWPLSKPAKSWCHLPETLQYSIWPSEQSFSFLTWSSSLAGNISLSAGNDPRQCTFPALSVLC